MDDEVRCQQLVEIITDYLEDALPAGDRARVERHLDECSLCATYLDQLRQVVRLTGMLRTEDIPPAALDDLLAAFRSLSPPTFRTSSAPGRRERGSKRGGSPAR